MKELYRIKNGKLKSRNYDLNFIFGLIFEKEGFLFFDFYISEESDLDNLQQESNDFIRQFFLMTAITEDNNAVKATELFIRNIYWGKSKISMQCSGHLLHQSRSLFSEDEESKTDKNLILYYLELEGLKMKFTDRTEIIKARNGERIDEFAIGELDHSTATLIYNGSSKSTCNFFNLIFSKNKDNDNVIVTFPNNQQHNTGVNKLLYEVFNEFKRDFIFLLSLLNGAEVAIRKEFIGGWYNIGTVNSEIIKTYSHESINNIRYNDYVPLNYYMNEDILNHALCMCFDKFVIENKKLDLNSIIFYLNGAQKSVNIQEKFFIEIIAFERLVSNFMKTLDESDSFIISDNDFKEVREELINVLKKHPDIIGDKLEALSNKIRDMNKAKSAMYKFQKLLDYSRIEISADIKNIIKKVRNTSIHEGHIGTGEEGIRNYFILDELLRDIILNLIGYNKTRNSRVK